MGQEALLGNEVSKTVTIPESWGRIKRAQSNASLGLNRFNGGMPPMTKRRGSELYAMAEGTNIVMEDPDGSSTP